MGESGEKDLLMSCLTDSRDVSISLRQAPCSVLDVSTAESFDAMVGEFSVM